jgi:pilus assembly protein Flp/PilA
MMKTFLEDRSGATAIEYGLIVGLVCIVMLVGFGQFNATLFELFSDNNSAMSEVWNR